MIEAGEKTLLLRLKTPNPIKAILIVVAITLLLFFTDYITGNEISFSIFYLIPITFAVIWNGKLWGVIFSVICAMAWIGAELLGRASYSSIFIPVWNTLVRFSYFIFHTLLISNLLESIRKLRFLSLHDHLTNSSNWRHFEEYSNSTIRKAIRERKNIALAYFDIDDFKTINDTLGHSVGDEVLREMSQSILKEIRPMDMLARLGGDEFAILIYGTDLSETKIVIDRIRKSVDETMRVHGWNVTLSIGVIVFSVLSSTIGPLIKRADDLMYEVKNSGKNNAKIIEQFK
jgi:diguanylate cyclase (GGDEF)-like protein